MDSSDRERLIQTSTADSLHKLSMIWDFETLPRGRVFLFKVNLMVYFLRRNKDTIWSHEIFSRNASKLLSVPILNARGAFALPDLTEVTIRPQDILSKKTSRCFTTTCSFWLYYKSISEKRCYFNSMGILYMERFNSDSNRTGWILGNVSPK